MTNNSVSYIVFIAASVGLVLFLNKEWRNVIWNLLLRCLSGLVLVYAVNYIITCFGGDIDVKINEITAAVSAILGIGGVIGLYALQLFFTIPH